MNEKIKELTKNQVWDAGRGQFVVGLKPTKQTYRGLRVYEDAFGAKFTIAGAQG